MSSITRAVTAKFGNKRQRLFADKEALPASTSDFNCYIPPEILWEDYQAQHQVPLKVEIVPEPEEQAPMQLVISEKKPSPNSLAQKMTAVVRKLSPFSSEDSTCSTSSSSSSSSSSSKDKDSLSNGDDTSSSKKSPTGGAFKGTKQRIEKKMKKIRRNKDREQLIDSSDDDM